MPKPDYSPQFITKAQTAKIQGFNIYALIHKYQKISKTAELIPESVYMAVLDHYLTDGAKVRSAWPYFITVLRVKSEEYFSRKNEEDGKRLKALPANTQLIREIFNGK